MARDGVGALDVIPIRAGRAERGYHGAVSSSLRARATSVVIAVVLASAGVFACLGEDVSAGGDPTSTADAGAATNDAVAPDATTPAADAGSTCPSPLADCNGDGVCETSLDTDPKNCGVCGRDCGGGACDKTCKPATLVNGLTGPVAVAVNQTALVVLATDGPRVCPKDGCVSAGISPISLETGETIARGPHTLYIDATDAYWLGNQDGTTRFELKKCAVSGCGLSPNTVDEAQLGAELRAEGTSALRYDPTGGVTRIYLDGSKPKEYWNKTTIASSSRFAVSGGKVAFSNTDGATGGNRGVWAGPFSDTIPTRVMNEGTFVALYADVVYAARAADATYDAIFSCPIAGCGGVGTNLGGTGPSAGTGKVQDMIADASGLTWIETIGTTGRVMRCTLPGCAGGPQALAVAQEAPVALTADDKFVYWVNAGKTAGTGTVMRVAK